MNNDLYSFDATALAALIRDRKLSASELLEDTIARIERINPRLNAVIHKSYDYAREQARQFDDGAGPSESDDAPFRGVPFLVKDLQAEVKGLPLSEGSRFVHGYVSHFDSELVNRQKRAGLIVTGKTNTPEFGLVPTTEPELYGPTHNPWQPNLTPGGSSGGAAAAVAAGLVPMAHGNDGGGSIRIPASCCGLFGLKPTRGRNPLGPVAGDIGSGAICEHALTRSVRDSAALLDATAGPQPGSPYWAPPKARPYTEEAVTPPDRLKIGVLDNLPDGWASTTEVHPDCSTAVQEAAELCGKLGHTIVPIDRTRIAWPDLFRRFSKLFGCTAAHSCLYWEKELGKEVREDQVEPMTWRSRLSGLQCSGGEYLAIVQELQQFTMMLADYRQEQQIDLLLSPTMTVPPTQLGAFTPTEQEPKRALIASDAFIAFTKIQNITGDPAMSVPLHWNTDNIPIGVHFAGRFGDEATLFRLAGQLEQARPWQDRRPSIHCSTVYPKVA